MSYAHTFTIRQRADGRFAVTHSFKTDNVKGWLHAQRTFKTRAAAVKWVAQSKEIIHGRV